MGDADMRKLPCQHERLDAGREFPPTRPSLKPPKYVDNTLFLQIRVPSVVWSGLGGAGGYVLIAWLMHR